MELVGDIHNSVHSTVSGSLTDVLTLKCHEIKKNIFCEIFQVGVSHGVSLAIDFCL